MSGKKVKKMKLVTVRCRPILGTDFACKSLYRFEFGNVFLEMRVPHRTAIFKQGQTNVVYNFVSTEEFTFL